MDVGHLRNKGKSADLVCYNSPEERKGHIEGHGKVQICGKDEEGKEHRGEKAPIATVRSQVGSVGR